MKKLAVIGGVLLLAMVSYPAFARGPGYGGGCRGYGPGAGQESGPGYCWNNDGGPGNLSSEQRTKLDKLRYAFLGDTADLRNKIWSKRAEMEKLLNSENPDEKKIRELQKEISALKSEMGDKRISFALEAKKIAPDVAVLTEDTEEDMEGELIRTRVVPEEPIAPEEELMLMVEEAMDRETVGTDC